jgi:hypothetical protein
VLDVVRAHPAGLPRPLLVPAVAAVVALRSGEAVRRDDVLAALGLLMVIGRIDEHDGVLSATPAAVEAGAV